MKTIFIVVVLTVIFIIGMTHIERDRTQGLNEIEISYKQAMLELGASDDSSVITTTTDDDEETEAISITISGEIKKPGTYKVDSGSYLNVVIEKAGGLNATADSECFDEYYVVEDGDEIYIAPLNDNVKVSLNKGTATDFDTLPTIGATIAQRIVEYREAYGDFTHLEQVKNVSGIGSSRFEKIKDYIKLWASIFSFAW